MNKRTILTSLFSFFILIKVIGQRPLPGAYNSSVTLNYVRSWDAVGPEIYSENLVVNSPLYKARISTSYQDGLGRPIQVVIKQGSLSTAMQGSGTSPVAFDMVKPVEYDQFGREQFRYMSFPANSTGGNTSLNDGMFKLNPFQQQETFFSSSSIENPIQGQGESFFYGQTVFEPSPLNRPLSVYAPGNNWVGNNKGVNTAYWYNTSIDEVRIWEITEPASAGDLATYATSSIYLPGQLQKTVTTDENDKQVIEFKDKEGKIVLKKVQLTAANDNGGGSGHAGWINTYYIYDDLGRLRAVIQPEGVSKMPGWNLSASGGVFLKEQCFRYEYDAKGRMVQKQVPGADPVFMIYDQRDRLVLTQDGNMRVNNKWLFTKYDALNRPIITGFYTNTIVTGQPAMQALVDGQTLGVGEQRTNQYMPGYTLNQSFPVAQLTDLLTVTYYDDYNWTSLFGTGLSQMNNSHLSEFTLPQGSYPYPQAILQSNAVKGMVTGSWDRASLEMLKLMYYDEKGRVIQTRVKQASNFDEVTTVQYAYAGQVLQSVQALYLNGSTQASYQVQTKNELDALGRPSAISKKFQVGTTVASWKKVVSFSYDALGQMKKKILSPEYNQNEGLESLAYDYNIRGWTLGMNRDYAKESGAGDHYFGFDLGYDKTGVQTSGGSSVGNYAQSALNGNITGTVWKSKGDGIMRMYDFNYDAVNRLKKADFKENTDGGWNITAADFSVGGPTGMEYDDNGNITAMWQKGVKGLNIVDLDKLTYKYYPNTNKLQQVTDDNNDPDSKLGDFKYKAGKNWDKDYGYDANGNMVTDRNKNIGSTADQLMNAGAVQYNYLNLPVNISISKPDGSPKGTIQYVYDGSGQKMKKIVTELGAGVNGANKVTTTTYWSSFVFEEVNDGAVTPVMKLQFTGFEEGRARLVMNPSTQEESVVLDYMIKDHLGNVRALITEEEKTQVYLATMESNLASQENELFARLDQTRIAISQIDSNYTPDNVMTPGDKVAKVIADDKKIGPALTLRVMAGDKVNLRVHSWYKMPGSDPGNDPDMIGADLLSIMSLGIGGQNAVLGETPNLGSPNGLLSSSVGNFITDRDGNADGDKPKAFLTWILLDDRLNIVSSSSGSDQVGDNGIAKEHLVNEVAMEKNGYLFVYVSNASTTVPVYFDNLQVTYNKGRLLEETHYYPFGLTMAGISSKAASFGQPENKKKYNGIEQNTDFDLNTYEAFYRTHDPQIGRWWQIDPKPTHLESPYAAMGNNPMRYADFLGDTAIVFGADGNFLRFQDDGKKKFSGRRITSETTTTNADGTTTTVTKYSKFKLNDGKLVAQAVKNGVINKVEFVTDEKINRQIERSGVHSAEAQKNPLTFAKNSGTAGGGMDYAVQGAAAGDLNKNTLYVTGGVGYDIADFGNFLWGRGMGELGIDLLTSKLGAQYNHIFNGRRGNDVTPLFDLGPGTYGSPGLFDAASDQQAINNGHYSSPRVIREGEAALKRLEQEMKYGSKF